MRPQQIFEVVLTNGEKFSVKAHFMTVPDAPVYPIRFWIKPHWYSRRRCVSQVLGGHVKAVSTAGVEAVSDWIKEAGIKL